MSSYQAAWITIFPVLRVDGRTRQFEDHQKAEALKRREEIKAIDKQLADIEKRLVENMKKK